MSQRINLNIHEKLSLLSGFSYPLPEDFSSRSKCFRGFWSLYVYIPNAFMLIELMSQAVQISLSYNNVEFLTTCILSTLYVVQYLLKLFVFNRNKKIFYKIFKEMTAISRDLEENPFGDGNFLKYFDSYYKKVMNIGLWKGGVQMICNSGLCTLFCVLSWVGMKPKITPAFSWTPYDNSQNPGYSLTCVFEMICFGAVTARTGACDLLFWVMVIIPSVQFKYLKHLMEIMMKDTDKDVQKVEDYDIVEAEVSEEVLRSQLDWWTKMHQRTLRVVHDFECLASPFLAVNYIASLIDLFMSGFVAMSSSQWDILQRILINAVIITDVFQLYVVSLAGDLLRESSQNVADYGFTALIFKAKKDFRQHYLFVLARSRRLIQIRFGGINPLSSQTFSRLIQLTVTYFVTVIQIKNSQNEKSGQSITSFLA